MGQLQCQSSVMQVRGAGPRDSLRVSLRLQCPGTPWWCVLGMSGGWLATRGLYP